MKKLVYQVEQEDARKYRETLYALRKKMIREFERTTDMSLRKWINKHGQVLDDLIEELGGRP